MARIVVECVKFTANVLHQVGEIRVSLRCYTIGLMVLVSNIGAVVTLEGEVVNDMTETWTKLGLE